MVLLKRLQFVLIFTLSYFVATADSPVHVWEMQEITLTANGSYNNPYTELKVWVDLTGPGFSKRVYGFWDGGNVFRVRIVATRPGAWSWKSGSSSNDSGLTGKTGSFNAIEWSEQEKDQNPLRHGFLRASANKHALIYADSTPYLAIGDTWFGLGASRYKWYDDEVERPIGPDAGFKDYVRLRKAQGYNWINVIAAFPNWKTDDSSWLLTMHDSAKTTVRSAWMEFGTGSAKNMDNEGGRPFLFVACAITGSIAVDFILSKFKVSGWFPFFAIYISPFCMLAYLFLKYLLLYVRYDDQHEFGPGSLSVLLIAGFSIVYSILVKTIYNIRQEDARR